MIFTAKEQEKFWSKVAVGEPNKCWAWQGYVRRTGYGILYLAGRRHQVHRVSLTIHLGGIPKGLVVDHICRNRACVNPVHLRAVTIRQNTLENSLGPAAINKAKTKCSRGHKFSKENTTYQVKWSRRECRECRRFRERRNWPNRKRRAQLALLKGSGET